MNNFYGNQLSGEQLQQQLAAQQQRQQQQQRQMAQGNMGIPNTSGAGHNGSAMAGDTPMFGGDSLDDIIHSNDHEMMNRRRSLPQQQYAAHYAQNDADRRLSMMDFPGTQNLDFGAMPNDGMAHFGMPGNMGMGVGSSNYPHPQPNMLSGGVSGMPNMMGDMMRFSNLSMGSVSGNPSSSDMLTSPTHVNNGGSGNNNNSMHHQIPDFQMDVGMENMPLSATSNGPPNKMGLGDWDEDMMEMPSDFSTPNTSAAPQQVSSSMGVSPFAANMPSLSREPSGATQYQSPTSGTPSVGPAVSQGLSITTSTPATGTSSNSAPTPQEAKPEKNIYSKSGFDMIRALYYVATRPSPEVQLGAVDMSCAFVVCDVTQNDCPIVYVSDNFQNLTGYSRYEIMGQNCRFLQAPDGKVESGTRREFVENDAVYNLKKKIAEGKEVQQSLINYRKGGKPFLNLLTMIPIPWDNKDEIRYFVGFQIDLVECPDAISGQDMGNMHVNYKHSEIQQYIWNPPTTNNFDMEGGQTLGVDDVSTLLQQYNPKGLVSDWHKQSWDKMLLENTDDIVHVLSLKGLFLYLSPSAKKVVEYESPELVGKPLSSICHPSDIIPVTRELKDAQIGATVNVVFRIRRKLSGYTWFESRGSLFVEQGKGRKCIILIGRKRPVFALNRKDLEANGGIGDSEMWTKLSTSGMFLFVSSNIRSLLDLQPDGLVGTSIQDLMRKESRAEFGRSIEKARRGKIVSCKHEVQNRRGQVLQAQTILYPGDAAEGEKPTFILAQTRLLKASSRSTAPSGSKSVSSAHANEAKSVHLGQPGGVTPSGGRIAEGSAGGLVSASGGGIALGSQDAALAADDNIFDELKTTRCTSWQFELRQMEKENRSRAEELGQLLSSKKKRKRRKGVGNVVRDCANCHTRNTPEWRRGPSGQRDLCNSCGLRWAKQIGRVSPRNSSRGGNDTQSKKSNSPIHSSPLQRELGENDINMNGHHPNGNSSMHIPAADNAVHVTASALKLVPSKKPPHSQPLLEGGSGMEMTSIREERETSA